MCHDFTDSSVKKNQVYKRMLYIPESVTIETNDCCVLVEGKKGKLTHNLHPFIDVKLNHLRYLNIYSKIANNKHKPLIGTTRALINGMIIGVTLGFVKKLQLVGIGYKANINENNIINLTIGLSHSVNYVLPLGIDAQCLNNTEIILSGINKQLIGQVAANLRAIRPPEPFKGKGIRYLNEVIYSKDAKKR